MNQIFAQLFYEMEKHRDTVLVTLIDAAIASVDDDMAFCDVLTQCLETEE